MKKRLFSLLILLVFLTGCMDYVTPAESEALQAKEEAEAVAAQAMQAKEEAEAVSAQAIQAKEEAEAVSAQALQEKEEAEAIAAQALQAKEEAEAVAKMYIEGRDILEAYLQKPEPAYIDAPSEAGIAAVQKILPEGEYPDFVYTYGNILLQLKMGKGNIPYYFRLARISEDKIPELIVYGNPRGLGNDTNAYSIYTIGPDGKAARILHSDITELVYCEGKNVFYTITYTNRAHGRPSPETETYYTLSSNGMPESSVAMTEFSGDVYFYLNGVDLSPCEYTINTESVTEEMYESVYNVLHFPYWKNDNDTHMVCVPRYAEDDPEVLSSANIAEQLSAYAGTNEMYQSTGSDTSSAYTKFMRENASTSDYFTFVFLDDNINLIYLDSEGDGSIQVYEDSEDYTELYLIGSFGAEGEMGYAPTHNSLYDLKITEENGNTVKTYTFYRITDKKAELVDILRETESADGQKTFAKITDGERAMSAEAYEALFEKYSDGIQYIVPSPDRWLYPCTEEYFSLVFPLEEQ